MKNNAAYQEFCGALNATLKRFGVNDDFVDQYLRCLEQDSREANHALHLLFNQLQLALSGNTWE